LNKHTLYITFDGLCDPLGQSQILPYLVGIAKEGYHIHILSCEKTQRLKTEGIQINKLIANLSITWQFITYNESGGAFSRWLYTRRLEKMAQKVRKNNKIELVHCRSYLASLVGLKFRIRYKIPFVFDMRGFWADERIEGKIWDLKKRLHATLYKYFKQKEKQFLETADYVVSLTHAGLNEMTKVFPNYLLTAKTKIIPCCTNTALFDPNLNFQKPEIKFNKQDHVLIYTGSIGTWYFTKEMIDCVLNWQKQIPSIKLLILTKDRMEAQTILKSYGKGIDETVTIASADHRSVPNYLRIAKAAIFFIKPSYSKIASSPTKMAECWAMDLPVITNTGIGDNDLYFKNNNGGVLIQRFNEEEYSKACDNYLSLNSETGKYRKIAVDYFDHQQAIKSYVEIYKLVLEKNATTPSV